MVTRDCRAFMRERKKACYDQAMHFEVNMPLVTRLHMCATVLLLAASLAALPAFAAEDAREAEWRLCAGGPAIALEQTIQGCSAIISAGDEVAANAAIAYSNRGNAFKSKGDLTSALSDYAQAVTLNPNDAVAYYNRANAYLALNNLPLALTDFDAAIKLSPVYADAYLNRGATHATMGSRALAIADYDAAIRIAPGNPQAYMNRGVTHLQMRQFDLALADFQKASALAPEFVDPVYGSGIVYQLTGQSDAAIAAFDRVIALTPQRADAFNARAVVYENKGDLMRAIEDYETAIRLDSPGEALYRRNLCWARAVHGQPESALSDCNRALALSPAAPDVLSVRAFVYLLLEQPDAAQNDCGQAMTRTQKLPVCLALRGKAKQAAGDATGGEADFAAVRALDAGIAKVLQAKGLIP